MASPGMARVQEVPACPLEPAEVSPEGALLHAAGRRVAYLSAYNHNGAVRFSAIFQQTNIEGNETTTLGRHNLTSSGYQTEYDSRLGQGYLTRCVAGYSVGSSAEFAAIWRKP